MKFKDEPTLKGEAPSLLAVEWSDARLSVKLKNMVIALDELCRTLKYPRIVVTCIYREGDKGQHGRWKAIDIRAHHGYYTAEQACDIAQWARMNFPRHDTIPSSLEKAGEPGTKVRVQALPVLFHGYGAEFHGHCSVDG